ncbi:energy transducer TonB [Mucilaginibacter sp. dw_454]|uniref:energy transducer TonB n=1 Tax=Mucilaginibacter sp. dw_454 TaxID=2720079 RepID=UPI001BD41DCA|nr:energy transducer TonB [Mucilaginibacter sp. dw_454]
MELQFCFFLVITSQSFAQTANQTFFFKNNGRQVNRLDSADFVRVVLPPDSGSKLFNITEYYKDKTRKLVGKSWAADKMQFDGQVQSFYPSGKKQEMSNYKNARKLGDSYEYYPNGKLYVHKKYLADDERVNGISELMLDCRDSTGAMLATNGEGHYIAYSDKFSHVYDEGSIKNGLKEGEWKGDNGDKDHHITFTEVYENGKLESGKALHLYEDKTYTYTERNIQPQYPGGLGEFGKYLGTNIRYPGVSSFTGTRGRLIARFVILPDGTLSEITIADSPDVLMSKEAVRVLNASPKWVPGYAFGKAARISYTVPINFTM